MKIINKLIVLVVFFLTVISSIDFNMKRKKQISYDGEYNYGISDGSGEYIFNKRYFDLNPRIGDNYEGDVYGNGNTGTCGVIAAQLLLTYNNFYNDRRIIDDRYFSSYKDENNNWVSVQNPNTMSDPARINPETISTNCSNDDPNSFYLKLINTMMRANESGLSLSRIKSGIITYLQEQNFSNYTITSGEKNLFQLLFHEYISTNIITSEIDNGRPLIITTSEMLCDMEHVMVCYGYEYHNVDGVERLGYVVNFGWYDAAFNHMAWIDARSVDGYIKLDITHDHRYSYYDIVPNTFSREKEYRCSECGHRTNAAFNINSEDRYDEEIFYINPHETKEVFITCGRTGNYLIQTFGNLDTVITLLDENYHIVASNDDFGFGTNGFFNYTFERNKTYRLLVRLYHEDYSGYIKIGACSPSHPVDFYTYIPIINETPYYFWTYSYKVEILRFKPTISGTYQIQTIYIDNTNDEYEVDNVLYFIIPSTTSEALFNDDDAGDYQGMVTIELEANTEYIIVVSQYNVSLGTEMIGLEITRLT